MNEAPARASPSPTSRLTTRVVFAAVASAALGGAMAALIAVIAVDRLVSGHMDRGLTGAAIRLADELRENELEPDPESLDETVLDENEEIAASGIRFTVYQNGAYLAGDATVPLVASDSCETLGLDQARLRVCGARYKGWSLVAASKSDDETLRLIYALGGLGALLLGGLAGALVGVRLARWALRPLVELSSALRHMAEHAAEGQALALDSSCQEVQEIASAIDDLLQRIRALLGQAQRFAAHAAHELRTPLTTIRAELELLIEEAQRRPEQAALQRIQQRTAQLGELVERLLFLSSPPEPTARQFEPVALADLIEELVSRLPEHERSRVKLELEGEGLTRGEPSLLSAMIANAIDNALKHSGADEVRVKLEVVSAAEVLHVDVIDQGRGVAPELRQRVFEPFYRASPDVVAGHGLGLTLIGHIAEAHGGSATFLDSTRGAHLRLTLPTWRPTPQQ